MVNLQEMRKAWGDVDALVAQVEESAGILNTIHRKHKDPRKDRWDSIEVEDIDWELGEATLRCYTYGSCGGDEWSKEFPLRYLGLSLDEMEALYLKEKAVKEAEELRIKEDTLKQERLKTLVTPDSEIEEEAIAE